MNDGLVAADAGIRSDPDLAHMLTLVVSHHGDIVFDRCYRDTSPADLHCAHSVTKSFTSTVVGILAGEGVLSLDTPVASILDAPALGSDPAKTAITVRHLLTMTSGLYGHGWWDIDELADRGHPIVDGALHAPLVAAPGWGFLYNNGASHVLSAVVEAVAGKPLAEVARERLFAPLGIEHWRWPTDPQGRSWGCGDLEMAGRDLLKLGLLYLAGGVWDGARVLDEAYVRAATSPVGGGGPPEFCNYGFLWWVADLATPSRYFAGGYGGQYVVVVPDLDLVVVTMADAYERPRPRGDLVRRLIMETVVAAFAAVEGSKSRLRPP